LASSKQGERDMPAIPVIHTPQAASAQPKAEVHAPYMLDKQNQNADKQNAQAKRFPVRVLVEGVKVESKRKGKTVKAEKIQAVAKANLSKIDPTKKGEVKLTVTTGRGSDANRKIVFENFNPKKDKNLYHALLKTAELAIEKYRQELPDYKKQKESHKGHGKENPKEDKKPVVQKKADKKDDKKDGKKSDKKDNKKDKKKSGKKKSGKKKSSKKKNHNKKHK
jgi:hypothetical protein